MLVASILLTGKAPHILEAIRMVPHGKQKGLKRASLCGMVDIDPNKDDFFRHVIEQREHYKSNRVLKGSLKVLANAGSYGLFVEVTPETVQKLTTMNVFSGEKHSEHEGIAD